MSVKRPEVEGDTELRKDHERLEKGDRCDHSRRCCERMDKLERCARSGRLELDSWPDDRLVIRVGGAVAAKGKTLREATDGLEVE